MLTHGILARLDLVPAEARPSWRPLNPDLSTRPLAFSGLPCVGEPGAGLCPAALPLDHGLGGLTITVGSVKADTRGPPLIIDVRRHDIPPFAEVKHSALPFAQLLGVIPTRSISAIPALTVPPHAECPVI